MFFHSDTLFSRETTLFNGLTWVTWSTQSHSPPHWRSPAPNDTIRNTHIHSDCQLFYDDRKHCQSVVLEERRKVVEPWKTRCAKHKQCAVPCQRAFTSICLLSLYAELLNDISNWSIAAPLKLQKGFQWLMQSMTLQCGYAWKQFYEISQSSDHIFYVAKHA